MNTHIKYSVQEGRLAVDFSDEQRSVFIKGENVDDKFFVDKDHFDSFPSLSQRDREAILQALSGDKHIIID